MEDTEKYVSHCAFCVEMCEYVLFEHHCVFWSVHDVAFFKYLSTDKLLKIKSVPVATKWIFCNGFFVYCKIMLMGFTEAKI